MSPRGDVHPLRGQAWFAEIPNVGRKPLVVVSNNRRNTILPDFIGARITSAPKPALPSIVPLGGGDPLKGSVLCDEVFVIPRYAIRGPAGALSRATMRAVDEGLKVALALS